MDRGLLNDIKYSYTGTILAYLCTSHANSYLVDLREILMISGRWGGIRKMKLGKCNLQPE